MIANRSVQGAFMVGDSRPRQSVEHSSTASPGRAVNLHITEGFPYADAS
jgi:hypothetical protein